MTFVSRVLVVLAVLLAGTDCRNSGDAVPEGHDMTLALSVSGQPAGTFQLRRGAEPAFDPCNF